MLEKIPAQILIFLLGIVFLASFISVRKQPKIVPLSVPTPTSTPKPTPTPTPKPLTFAEMNALYGPCAYLPTLFYHHIDNYQGSTAKVLTVDKGVFAQQMQYLADRGYQTLTMRDLINFFDQGIAIPKKTILLTFDDGYEDFYLDAFPILQSHAFKATVFLPTGLVGNSGFLNWSQISQMAGSGIYFANHTWSHKSVTVSKTTDEQEISTADIQLKEHGLNQDLVFGYPYGSVADYAVDILREKGYNLAFTTQPGTALCKKQRFVLPRVRIGNTPLSSYGF